MFDGTGTIEIKEVDRRTTTNGSYSTVFNASLHYVSLRWMEEEGRMVDQQSGCPAILWKASASWNQGIDEVDNVLCVISACHEN